MHSSPSSFLQRIRRAALFAALGCLITAAQAAVVSYTISGKTTSNIITSEALLSEFPVGTAWSAVLKWETTSSALFLSATQGQYRLTEFTLTLNGKTGPWTTSSTANAASFTLNANGGSDEMQFTSGWGPTNHTNATFFDMQPYSINVVLEDPTGAAISTLGAAPSSLTFSQWSSNVANSYLKFYLNNDGNRFIMGNIESIAVTGASEPNPPAEKTLTVTLPAAATVQWQLNGANVSGATSASLDVATITPATSGVYTAVITSGSTTTTQSFIVGESLTTKVAGAAAEIASNIVHPNGNTFDQILLNGSSASFTADSTLNQITRLSFVDLTNDIVQVEFSGAGTLSIVLEGATGPAVASNYNQPGTNYMKGHATVVITGANETTNLSIFSVGSVTAVNQALFLNNVTYDGYADVALVAVHSSNGKFGTMRSGNASFWNTKGLTGVYAPGVTFQNEIFIHDINARENATPTFVVAGAKETRITGGDLTQTNSRAVQVDGLTELQFTAGTSSHGTLMAAQTNQARLERNGVDVTAQIVPGSSSGGTGEVAELTFFTSAGNPPYANGTKKTFEVSLTVLKFDGKTLTNPTPLTVNAPMTGAAFTDPATGFVWQVYFRNGALHEINLMNGSTFLGQWD